MLKPAIPFLTLLNSLRWSTWGQQYCALLGAAVAILTMVILLARLHHCLNIIRDCQGSYNLHHLRVRRAVEMDLIRARRTTSNRLRSN